jgi:hypothetical protein
MVMTDREPQEKEAEAPPAPTAPAPEDIAAHDYMKLLPMWEKKIEELSNRQLKNVATGLMRYPFVGEIPSFSYPQESQLFLLGLKILDCKFVLMKAALDLKESEINTLMNEQTAKNEATNPETTMATESVDTQGVENG